jgi:FkbM family methyltransferase
VNEEKTMQSSKYSSFLNSKGKSIKVAMRTLEGYLREQNLDYIDLVKMDIEGMEFEVLESWDDELFEKI